MRPSLYTQTQNRLRIAETLTTMRITISLLAGIVLALIIAGLSSGLLYANQEPGASGPVDSAQGRPLAQVSSTSTPTPTRTPTRTPTLRFTFALPGSGNANIFTNTNGSELDIEATVDSLEVEVSGNGRGIRYVDMFVYDSANNLVDSHRENNYPYCYFQENSDGDCATWDFANHNFRWPGGAAVKNGQYFARVIGYTDNNKILMDEDPFYIDMEADRFIDGIDIDVGDDIDRGNDPNRRVDEYINALRFRGDVFSDGSLPVTRVVLFVVAPDGTIPFLDDESNEPYCAFGDSGAGSDCTLWNFRANRDLWPSGVPIQRTYYAFRALAFSGNTLVGADSRTEAVRPSQQVQPPAPNNPPSNNPPPNNPPSGNPPSGGSSFTNFKILADGSNDVSEVNGGLVFRTFAGVNGTDGDGIDHVEMAIYDVNGIRVHFRSEVSPSFCAYGGNESCNALTFAWEGYRWSNGSSMQNGGVYTLRATIYFRDGRAPLAISRDVVIRF